MILYNQSRAGLTQLFNYLKLCRKKHMCMYTQNQPMVFHPQYIANPQAVRAIDQYRDWNYMYKQYREFLENLSWINRQADIYQRRNIISGYIPQDLLFFGYNPLLPAIREDDFRNIVNYIRHDTRISEECAELLLCAHILAAVRGRIMVENGDHHESAAIYTLGIANSGQRKSTVNERLCAPALAFEEKLKANLNTDEGLLARRVMASIPKLHANKILANIDFDSPQSILEAINKAREADSSYDGVIDQIRTTPSIYVTDVTPFQLSKILLENGEAQLLASAEGGGLEKLLLHKDTELLLKSYGQEPYKYASAKATITLLHPSLNIAVLAQPLVALKLYTSASLYNRGQISRIMPCVNMMNPAVSNNGLRGDEADIYERKIIKLLEKFYTRSSNPDRYIVRVEKLASDSLNNFRAEMDAWDHGLNTFRPWVSKLHGHALRIALAIHLWRNSDDPCGSLISYDEMSLGIEIARNSVNSAYFLHSPYGLTATLDAIKIIKSLQRLSSFNEQASFLQNGVNSRYIQQRTGFSRININNALYLLSWRGWIALYDDGSGNLKVLPHLNFFHMRVSEF